MSSERLSGTRWSRAVAVAALVLAAGGCGKTYEPPEKIVQPIELPEQTSIIAVPISGELSEVAAALEKEIPRRLWTIDKPDQVCQPSKKVDLAVFKVKTPTIRCRITGAVTRGRLSISGSGKNLVVTMPVNAVIRAKDIAGILKQETATGKAVVRATIRMDMAADWTPKAKVDINYDWTNEPGIDFLGQRVKFTDAADKKLAPVIGRLERTIPRELAKLNFKAKAREAWGQAFTSLELNEVNPPVWMRIVPQNLQYGGYSIKGRRLVLNLGLEAKTQTFVGNRPADPEKTALPPLQTLKTGAGKVQFAVPVLADYSQLEPVIMDALQKRGERPFVIPGIGPVTAKFSKVEAYTTTDGRIAVGVTFSAVDPGGTIGKANGTVWFTAQPVNQENSRTVAFENLVVGGVTDNQGTDLLIKLANVPGLARTISNSLTQNFGKDYQDLLDKVAKAIDRKPVGGFIVHARIDTVSTGQLKATGQGLYLPVYGEGTASLELAP